MAIPNFAYKHRCIVVINDDHEIDNIPSMGESIDVNRSYLSCKLEVDEDFKFWDIILTSGYYAGACIDYTEKDVDVEYWLGGTQYYNSKTDFFQECKDTFGLTEYRLRKVCGNIGDMDIEDYLEQAYAKLTNYLREQEEIKVNDCLDRIKQTYGYEEYKTECIMSNGEAIYKKVC